MMETDILAERVMPATELLLKSAQENQNKGDYIHAEELYREVLTYEPNNVIAMHHLSLMLMDNNLPHQAIPLLSRATEIESDNAYLYYNLGLAYQNSNELQAAIHNYKLAVEINDSFAQAYNNLGIAYQHLGKLEIANIYLEKAFIADPNCIDAYYNFSQTHKFSETDQKLIKTIETLLKSCPQESAILTKIHFTLGKIYDDIANYQRAFFHFQKANSLKFHGFNSDALANYVDNIINTYSIDTINKLTADISPSKKRFIFVIGMPRSGTTLIEQVVANHPLVQSGGEIGFIGDVIDELPELVDSELPYPQCMEQFNQNMIAQLARKFLIYLDNLGGNFLHITDKSPINFLHIGIIKLLFPESTIIHVKRDPVAASLSCYFQNFDKQHQYSYNMESLGRFYKSYEKIMAHWEALFQDEIINIHYEDVVNNPEDAMKKLITQCGLNWDNNCYEYYNGNNIVTSASKWQTRQPIYKSSLNKWKNYEEFIEPLLNIINND